MCREWNSPSYPNESVMNIIYSHNIWQKEQTDQTNKTSIPHWDKTEDDLIDETPVTVVIMQKELNSSLIQFLLVRI